MIEKSYDILKGVHRDDSSYHSHILSALSDIEDHKLLSNDHVNFPQTFDTVSFTTIFFKMLWTQNCVRKEW